MFGFLNIYKPKGKTSHDVVAILRRITKVKQIGHTGTLDPFAEGVLPICIGKATRLIEYLKDDKAYVATVQLGSATDTYDLEGETTKTSDLIPSLDEIEAKLDDFRGEIEQTPPIYSAIKVNGKKLYEYARAGEQVEVKTRKVCISELKLLEYNQETSTLELYIACSKGTYIRSIANDLGEKLGCFGHLIKLVRVQAGDFVVEDAIKLEDLQTKEDVEKQLIYPLQKLNYQAYSLDEIEKEKISHGMQIFARKDLENGIVILIFAGALVAIANSEDNRLTCQKVFIS